MTNLIQLLKRQQVHPELSTLPKAKKAAPPMKPWFLTLRSGRMVDTTGRDTSYHPTKGWRSTRAAA